MQYYLCILHTEIDYYLNAKQEIHPFAVVVKYYCRQSRDLLLLGYLLYKNTTLRALGYYSDQAHHVFIHINFKEFLVSVILRKLL